jgi:hypothetical protein
LTEQRVCLNAQCSLYAGESHYASQLLPRFAPDYKDKVFKATQPKKEGGDPKATKKMVGWRSQVFKAYDDDATSTSKAPPAHPDALVALHLYTPKGNRDIISIKKTGVTAIAHAKRELITAKDKLTTGKRQCKLQRWFGISDLIMMIFIIVVLLVLGKIQSAEAEALDESEQTAQDYSVIIEDPDGDKTNPDEWKAWFEERFGAGTVFMVTVCLDNGPLLRLFQKKRFLENEMMLEAADDAQYAHHKRRSSKVDKALVDELEGKKKDKSCFKRAMEFLGLDPTMEYFTLQLLKVNQKIAELKDTKHKAVKVFIIFNTEHTQRECLNSMCVGRIPAAFDWKNQLDPKFLFDGNLMAITEAPEPSTVIYENLHEGVWEHAKQQVISWFCLGCGLVVANYSVKACFDGGQPALGAILISVWNSLLPMLNKFLVMGFETHHTTDGVEDSFLAKTVAARGFCSAIILYQVGVDHLPQTISPYYIGAIQAVLLADALTSPIIRLLDIGGNVNRFILAPISGTDARAKALNAGTDYLLAERYTDLCKTILMSLFFSAIFPLGYFYSAMACFISYWVDKFCVLRLFRQKPPAGDKLVVVTRTFIAIIVLIHAVVTAHFYYSWPFDNLCATGKPLDLNGQQIALALGAIPTEYFKQCNAGSRRFLPPSKAVQPWFQSDGAQHNLVVFYNVVAIIVLCYILITYFGFDASDSIYSLFFYKHQEVGQANDETFVIQDDVEGYVPQINVPGLTHSILCCHAPAPEAKCSGGLEFDTFLLNWTASRERSGNETEEELERFKDYTPLERDAEYRKNNCFFDDQLPPGHKLMSLAKQYLHNPANADVNEVSKHSVQGKAQARERAASALRKSDSGRGANPLAADLKGVAMVPSANRLTPKHAAERAAPAGEGALAAMAATKFQADDDDRAMAVMAAPAGEDALAMMAHASGRTDEPNIRV